MAEYGLTPNGPNPKRLDIILDEMHTKLTDRLGVNTRQNPQSLLNHLLTNVADQIAELWELGTDVYYSQYPATAEGVSLDNVAQLGGSTREGATKSYYPIHCTGVDGTTLDTGTMIASATNPTSRFVLGNEKTISRADCNGAVIKVAAVTPNSVYTVAINGTVYSLETTSEDPLDILDSIAGMITERGFAFSLDRENALLHLSATDDTATNELILSENLTTETVTSIITFESVETGDIFLPTGTITNIVKAHANLKAVENRCAYIAGHKEETDTEFRQSYADKIFNRSGNMLESIRSAILNHVLGVRSVATYENPSHEWDAYGRPPHSIEVVVDGGFSEEIAQQILENKAGGINTFGDTAIKLNGKFDEDIVIRFNRPVTVYTWVYVGITLSKTEAHPPNYAELLREVVLKNMSTLEAGDDVVPQQFMSQLYKACSGISYIDLRLYATTVPGTDKPSEYPSRSVEIMARQKAHTTEDMIEVEING